jgi:hypothetical protein
LGIFTGFRASEYSQGNLDRGKLFNTIPHKNDVPKVPGNDRDYVLIPHKHLATQYKRGDVVWLELCWRYDKSAFNFVKKRFKITGHPIYFAVDAAVASFVARQCLVCPTIALLAFGVPAPCLITS